MLGTPLITTNVDGIPEVVSKNTILLESNTSLVKNIKTNIKKMYYYNIYYKKLYDSC